MIREEQYPMASKSSTSVSASPTKTEVEKEDDDFVQRLRALPEQYREEILRQYDLPATKGSLVAILGFATWVEVILMAVGSILSIGAGPNPLI